MISEPHIMESLSRAYVRAIAAYAGLNCSLREYDYGVDGSFEDVFIREGRIFETGYSLSFQLKSSTLCQWSTTDVIYDLDSKNHTDLVLRHEMRTAIPCILILITLSPDKAIWLHNDETELRLQGGCYWVYLKGPLTRNKRSVRIRIPRQQILRPASLLTLMDKVKLGKDL